MQQPRREDKLIVIFEFYKTSLNSRRNINTVYIEIKG